MTLKEIIKEMQNREEYLHINSEFKSEGHKERHLIIGMLNQYHEDVEELNKTGYFKK
jgi:hypothetical protein